MKMESPYIDIFTVWPFFSFSSVFGQQAAGKFRMGYLIFGRIIGIGYGQLLGIKPFAHAVHSGADNAVHAAGAAVVLCAAGQIALFEKGITKFSSPSSQKGLRIVFVKFEVNALLKLDAQAVIPHGNNLYGLKSSFTVIFPLSSFSWKVMHSLYMVLLAR